MPSHDSEPLVNVLGEERYVALELKNAHSAVPSKRSWHTLSRSTSRSSSLTTQLKLGTITTTPNPCFVNMHRVSCDSSDTSLGNWFRERVCHSPPKVENLSFHCFQERVYHSPPKVENLSFHSLSPTGEGLVAHQDCNAWGKYLVPLKWMQLKGSWTPAAVTTTRSLIWRYLEPYLYTD